MTVPWSLTTTLTARVDTIIDTAEDREAAQTAALAEALDAIHTARISESPQAPRYELRAAGDLVALIQTGTDETGRPDHAATAALIQRIETARGLSASPTFFGGSLAVYGREDADPVVRAGGAGLG